MPWVDRGAGRRRGGRGRRPAGAVRVLGRGDLVRAAHPGRRRGDRRTVQRSGGHVARDGRRPRAGRPQQRSLPALPRRARRDRTAHPRRSRGPHDRQRHLDQRGMERRRAVAHRQRARAERRADRHPARAAGARDAPRHVARRDGRHGAASRSRVLVQQRARVVGRRRRERRGLGHVGRDDRARRARPPRAHEPLRLRRDAPLRGRPRLRATLGRPLRPRGRSCSPRSPTAR